MSLQGPASAPSGTIEARRGPDGHFTVEGAIGNAPMTFLVDTGASQVAIGRNDARRAGIWLSDADFTGEARTASSTVKVASRTLPLLRVGAIALRDVPALILDVPDATPLLGQSFLRRIGRVAIEGDRMTLGSL